MSNGIHILKLSIELVPSSSWYDNLRKKMPNEKWDEQRRRVYSEYDYHCGICGASGRMNCHELWSFDEKRRTQNLTGFIALCDLCHHVKHIGLAGIKASRGELDYDKIVDHFMNVNNCDEKTFEQHREEAFAIWEKRSKTTWKVIIGDFAGKENGDAQRTLMDGDAC